MKELVDLLLAIRNSNKPKCLWIDSQIINTLNNPDALSTEGTVFRNGGKTNSGEAIPYCEVTPELRALLKQIYS